MSAQPASSTARGTGEERDGRAVRAERTRQAIVDALLTLLESGEVRPTADQIAGAAGVSTRSVFQHFPDREDLLAAAGQRQYERIAPLLVELPDTGPLPERLDALVDQRARVLDAITPVRRAALMMEPLSPTVQGQLAEVRKVAAEEIARVFATELDPLEAAEREQLHAALTACAAWPMWNSLRVEQGLDHDQARAVLRRTLASLLGVD